ncbi:hypothetical protein [Mesorhizobium sp. CA16]|uniref:hypothetical protein n=1 Tax=Mesorhizobium sp. CA16 TaxID=588496 RepID=UPI001CC978A0|nr:hypothetical protein [Mesorhizobium sp. CA16]MBZ9911389.1 hypothetical protein [Mesorhizobium sp. CA16]
MPLSLRVLPHSEVLADVMAGLSIHGSSEAVRRAVVTAHLHAVCEADGARSGHGVFTGRLTDMIETNLAGLLGTAETRPLVKEVLDALAETGDLWRSPGGYWQSTPPRAVALSGGPSFLLGALPPGGFVAAGVMRYAMTGNSHMAVQSFDDWLGHIEPIGVWMAKALKIYRSRLQQSAVPADHLEIYAPDQAVQQFRSRWIGAREADLADVPLRLCRAQAKPTTLYNRPYYLGEFERTPDGLLLRRAAVVEHGHARRFRFAYDEALGVKRRLDVKRDDDLVQVTLANDLPVEEGRVLALGWRREDATSPSVRRMAFPVLALPFVAHALGRLGVQLKGGVS